MSTLTASNKDLTRSLTDMFSSKPSSPSPSSYEPGPVFSSNNNNINGDLDTGFFASITWQTWLIIVLILALLGINVFVYLAKGTGTIANIINKYFAPLLKLFGFGVLETTKQTISTSATGTKAGVDVVANTVTGSIDAVEGTATTFTGQQAASSQKGSMPVSNGGGNETIQDSLDSTLNDMSKTQEPQPEDSLSTYGKAGWCYIGEDRGTRTCSEVGVNDRCMSGNIFPSQTICMNPSLRA
jgi:hypothetical protein